MSPKAIQGRKVLFVTTGTGSPGQLYATEHFAVQSAREGIQVGLLGPHSRQLYAGLRAFHPYDAFVLKRPFGAVTRIRAFLRSMREFEPDLVHIRNHVGAHVLPVLGKLIGHKSKFVLDIRSLSPSRWKHLLFKCLKPLTSLVFDHFFALNRTILRKYTCGGKTGTLLPLGYDPNVFRPESARRPFTKTARGLRCIYYGTLNKSRQLEVVLRAFLELLDDGQDLTVNLVGEGDDKKRLRNLVPKEYSSSIQFHPGHDAKSLARFVRRQDLGIAYVPVTRIFDPNLPLKTVEMLASGIPVLATATSGNRIVVREGENGFLADDTCSSIEAALRRAINDNDVMSRSPASIAHTVGSYTWGRIARSHLFPVYERLLEAN